MFAATTNAARRLLVLAHGLARKTYVLGFCYTLFREHLAIRTNTVLLESHLGTEFFGSPRAIAEHLLTDDTYQHLSLVVVASKLSCRTLRTLFGDRRVRICRKGSIAYCFYLATSRWLVNDSTFPYYFSRRPEQKYLNTWHGTPLKSLGRRIAQRPLHEIGNTQRNFLQCTALLVPNPYTERVLLSDYMLEGIWAGDIIRCGYPRNDVLYRARDKQRGPNLVSVAFMPTWRGTFAARKHSSVEQIARLGELLSALDATLDPRITLWVRLHPLALGALDFIAYRRIKPFPPSEEPYAHLAECDALVTDYSSVMFDFALSGRPVILYEEDLDAYRHGRNFSMDPETLPFQRTTSSAALARCINGLCTGSVSLEAGPPHKYHQFLETYAPWDDGSNAKRLCASFFLGQQTCERVPWSADSTHTNILIYAGALLHNGIISSFKSLIEKLDTTKYRVTVLADPGHDQEAAEAYFGNVPDNIRYIPLNLAIPFTLSDVIHWLVLFFFRRSWHTDAQWLRRFWRREWQRLFGNTSFDVFVNFNGYSWRAAFLALGASCPSVVFVHNDMAKEVKARRVADARLLELSYRVASRVAVVREGAQDAYCNAHFDYRDKCCYVPNTLSLTCRENAILPLENAFKNGAATGAFQRVRQAVSENGKFRFVNVARFSPEKGQIRLIDAFEIVHGVCKDAQLFIIGSHGKNAEDVLTHARHSSASEDIFVIMGSGNPFPLMTQMNAFVFSSFYEGIGLVLFESFALGLPVVATDIPGPAELLRRGYGLVVKNSVDGLVDGMRLAHAGKVPTKPYDFGRHNRFALKAFDDMIGAATTGRLTQP